MMGFFETKTNSPSNSDGSEENQVAPPRSSNRVLEAAGAKGAKFKRTSSGRVEMTEDITNTNSGEEELVIKTTEEKLREAERMIASEIFYLNQIPDSLSSWSTSAMFFQFTQSLLLFFVAVRATSQWYWFVNYPELENEELDGLVPAPREFANFNVLWLVPFSTLLSGIEHGCCVMFRGTYNYYIERHQNPFRWTEYSFSAPLMKIIIAQQVGITDTHILIGLFMLMAVSIQCAATHESVNAKARSENRPQQWRPFFTGWIGHMTGWILIFTYFSALVRRGGETPQIWAIIITQFLLDTSFAAAFTLQWMKIGRFEDYILGEKAFITLSFTAKSLLAWISVANCMR